MKSMTKAIIGAAAMHGFHAARKKQKRLRVVFNTSLAVLIVVVSLLIEAVGPISATKLYALSPQMKQLIGDSRDDSSKYLKLDEKTGNYSFEVPKDTDNAKQHTGRKADSYSASFAKDPKEGISYTDTETNITIRMVPKFSTQPGQKVEGDHIVYPFGTSKLAYTLKYNGVKEDIILPSFQGNTLDYGFELIVPAGVELRLDKQGNLGIFSADTNFYGNITYGSDTDRELIDKAREKGEKKHLVATIPYPIVKDAKGKEHTDLAAFELGDMRTEQIKAAVDQNLPAEVQQQMRNRTTQNVYGLKLHAKNLKNLQYPISLDPTMQSTSPADFTNINPEGGTEIDPSGLIKRGGLLGGSLGNWSQNAANDMPTGNGIPTSTSYNGYLYVIDYGTGMQYAKLNGADVSGGWSTASVPLSVHGRGLVAYNGYLYVFGGIFFTCGSPPCTSNAAYAAKINPNDGSIGSWFSVSSLGNPRSHMATSAYNGYVYIAGGLDREPPGGLGLGDDDFTYYADVRRAQVNADGTLGNWSSAGSNFTTARMFLGSPSVIYNNTIYIVGGCNAGVTYDCDGAVFSGYYAHINSDGSIGSWNTITGNSPQVASFYTYNGYLVGFGNDANADQFSYAPLYSSGAIGPWQTQTMSFQTVGRKTNGTAFANGLVFKIGGTGSLASIESAPFNPAGMNSVWAAEDDFVASGSEREGAAVLVTGGSIMVIGGRKGSTYYNSVRRAVIASDGTIGTWTTDSHTFPNGRYKMGIAIDRSNLWIAGGYGTCGLLGAEDYCNDLYHATYDSATGAISANWDDPLATLPAGVGNRGVSMFHYYDKFYVTGGTSASGAYNTIYYFRGNSGGTLQGDAGCGSQFCQTTSFTGAREGHSLVQHNRYLYIIGGRSGATYYATVQYARFGSNSNNISSDAGCGSAWCSTTSFDGSQGRAYMGSGIWNGYIYLAGGCYNTGSCTTKVDTVVFAPINSDGTVGTWLTGSPLTTARSDAPMGIWQGYAYVFGGHDGTNTLRDTMYAQLNNGGSSRVSLTTTTSLPSARTDNAIVSYNGYIYSLGGCTAFSGSSCTTRLTDVVYTKVSDTGSLSAPSGACGATVWCSTGVAALPEARSGHAATVYAGKIFISGGRTSGGVSTDIKSININSDGTLGSWSSALSPALAVGKEYHQMLVYNGFIYSLMGGDGTTSTTNTIHYNTITTSGSLGGSWQSDTGSAAVRRQVNFAYAGRLYQFGDAVAQIDRYSAPLSSDGSVGSWENAGHKRYQAPHPRAVMANGRIFMLENNIVTSTFAGSGGIGETEWGGSTTSVNHSGGGFVYVNGYLYAIGGCTTYVSDECTTMTAVVDKATTQVIPRVAHLSRLYDFDVGVRPTKFITRGTRQKNATMGLSYKLPTANSANFTAATNDTITSTGHGLYNGQIVSVSSTGTLPAPLAAGTKYYVTTSAANTFKLSLTSGGTAVDITSIGSGTHTYKVFENATFGSATTISEIELGGVNALALSVASNTTLSRYFWVRYTIDDTYSAVFPDAGFESTITDFDLYYTSNPGTRLRGGRTFTSGTDRGLGASP